MFERFTDRARRSLTLAMDEARQLGLPYIDSDILLLGLAAEQEGPGAVALTRLGITADSLRIRIEARPVTEATEQPVAIPNRVFTSRAKKALELSLREALQLGHNYIGTEHVLLGINRQGSWLLPDDQSVIRRAVVGLLSEYVSARQPTAEHPERGKAERRALPDPEEPGIGVDERVRRIGMALNAELHPDYTDRELRMLDDLGSLVGWARHVLGQVRRQGVDYPLLADDLQRIEVEFGPWNES